MDTVSMPHCRQHLQPALGLCATCRLELEGQLKANTQSETTPWAGMVTFSRKKRPGTEKTLRKASSHTHIQIFMVTLGQCWNWLYSIRIRCSFLILFCMCENWRTTEALREVYKVIEGSGAATVHVSTESMLKRYPISKLSSSPSHCRLFIDQHRQMHTVFPSSLLSEEQEKNVKWQICKESLLSLTSNITSWHL